MRALEQSIPVSTCIFELVVCHVCQPTLKIYLQTVGEVKYFVWFIALKRLVQIFFIKNHPKDFTLFELSFILPYHNIYCNLTSLDLIC